MLSYPSSHARCIAFDNICRPIPWLRYKGCPASSRLAVTKNELRRATLESTEPIASSVSIPIMGDLPSRISCESRATMYAFPGFSSKNRLVICSSVARPASATGASSAIRAATSSRHNINMSAASGLFARDIGPTRIELGIRSSRRVDSPPCAMRVTASAPTPF